MKPLCIALFAGLHGWEEGFVSAGYRCVGFDIVDMCAALGVLRPPDTELVLQDVLTLHGSQFRDAACIVASPPCTEYSYMAMPWSRAKQIAAALRGLGEFPAGYTGSRTLRELNALFLACLRIRFEASKAAGRYIPLVVENVKGAQPWVGQAKARFGSYFLWGDVESVGGRVVAGRVGFGADGLRAGAFKNHATPGGSWFNISHGERIPGNQRGAPQRGDGMKTAGHVNKRDGYSHTRHLTNQRESEAVKNGNDSGSPARKAASAMIAKIPYDLAVYIARCFHPDRLSGVA